MLTNKSQYSYIDFNNDSVCPCNPNGTIIPHQDINGVSPVPLNAEDLLYLAEMAMERMFLCASWGNSYYRKWNTILLYYNHIYLSVYNLGSIVVENYNKWITLGDSYGFSTYDSMPIQNSFSTPSQHFSSVDDPTNLQQFIKPICRGDIKTYLPSVVRSDLQTIERINEGSLNADYLRKMYYYLNNILAVITRLNGQGVEFDSSTTTNWLVKVWKGEDYRQYSYSSPNTSEVDLGQHHPAPSYSGSGSTLYTYEHFEEEFTPTESDNRSSCGLSRSTGSFHVTLRTKCTNVVALCKCRCYCGIGGGVVVHESRSEYRIFPLELFVSSSGKYAYGDVTSVLDQAVAYSKTFYSNNQHRWTRVTVEDICVMCKLDPASYFSGWTWTP